MTEFVIFDCDRVPMDIEPIAACVLAQALISARLGAIEGEPIDDTAIPPDLASQR